MSYDNPLPEATGALMLVRRETWEALRAAVGVSDSRPNSLDAPAGRSQASEEVLDSPLHVSLDETLSYGDEAEATVRDYNPWTHTWSDTERTVTVHPPDLWESGDSLAADAKVIVEYAPSYGCYVLSNARGCD